MTLFLSESDVQGLIEMKDVVAAVEEAFRREGSGEASNFMRTRTRAKDSVLNVMHANLSYLGRGGLKAYMSSGAGVKFVIILFDNTTPGPLAVMGADIVGRYRTGAASAVATKHLCPRTSGTVAVFGSGRQALTQVTGLSAVMALDEVRVWSPNKEHREAFARRLVSEGYGAESCDSPQAALKGVELVSSVTSAKEPFLTRDLLTPVAHLNICGSNLPAHSEADPWAVGSFRTVAVDDLAQAKAEYGDLIRAAEAGAFSWDSAVELCDVVSGRRKPEGRTLFKSGGAAIEDVAVASMLYDKALRNGGAYAAADLV